MTPNSVGPVDYAAVHRTEQLSNQPAEDKTKVGEKVERKSKQSNETQKSSGRKLSAAISGGKMADVGLHFKVDPKTNDVIVFMVDRESKRVIRTIPPEELNTLAEGSLFEAKT
jgi:uncharacterized FlaG/YvyC family protein